MKPIITFISVLCLACLMFAGCSNNSNTTLGTENIKKDSLKTDEQKASYALGLNIGKSMANDNIKLDYKVFLKGIVDGVEKSKTALMTDDEYRNELMAFQQRLNDQNAKLNEVALKENKEQGKKFLEDNKKVKGVITLPSGLQYTVIKEGNGPKPKATDTVSVHYAGTLLDGTEFDSSVKRGAPAEFAVNGVIPGWVEALQLMSVGSKWKLFIPAELAYGDAGAGGDIKPGATLIFEVELLAIK